MKTYWIPSENASALSDKLNKLARKATKLGFSVVYHFTGNTRIESLVQYDSDGKALYTSAVKLLELTVEGQEPIIEGWQFVAVLQHESNGNVIRQSRLFSGELPEVYRTIDPKCDHCGLNRNRKDTYILRNVQSGSFQQVGSGCLVDFIGHGDPNSVAAYFESLLEIDAELEESSEVRGGFGEMMIATTDYLKFVCATINKYGWVSRSKANGDIPTADLAIEVASRPNNYQINLSGCQEEAERAVEWCLATWGNGNEYQHNVYVIAGKSWLSPRDFGLIASLIPAYRKAQSEGIKSGGFVGKQGEKLSLSLTHVATFTSPNRYGGRRSVTYINKFITPDNKIVVWMTDTWDGNDHKGETLRVVATVKAHNLFGNEQQTIITRAKIAE